MQPRPVPKIIEMAGFDSRRLHSAPRRLRRGIVRQAEGWVRPGGSATWARVDHDLRRAKHMVPGDPPLTVVTEHGNNFLDRSLLPGEARPELHDHIFLAQRATHKDDVAFLARRPADLRTSSPSLRPNNSPLRSRAMAPSQEETPGSISVSRASGRASRATAELAEPLRRGNAKGSHLRFADHRITSFRRRGQDNGEVPGRASKAMDGRPARRLARDHPTGS
jgi:hypothetical protein